MPGLLFCYQVLTQRFTTLLIYFCQVYCFAIKCCHKCLLLCVDIFARFIVLLSSANTKVYYSVKIFLLGLLFCYQVLRQMFITLCGYFCQVYCFAIKCCHKCLLLCVDIFSRFIVLLSSVATNVYYSVKIFLPGLLFCYQVLPHRFTTL